MTSRTSVARRSPAGMSLMPSSGCWRLMTLHSNPAETFRRARPLLGTLVEIGAQGPDALAAIEAAFTRVHQIQCLMSFHDADSDVSRINRAPAGREVLVDPHTHR